jgi:hypothetical protein
LSALICKLNILSFLNSELSGLIVSRAIFRE